MTRPFTPSPLPFPAHSEEQLRPRAAPLPGRLCRGRLRRVPEKVARRSRAPQPRGDADKLDMPRRAILAADRALQLTDGKEAKAVSSRGRVVGGEVNEAIADCDAAKRIEPGDKAIVAARRRRRTESATGLAADQRKVERLNDDDNSGDAWKAAEAENGEPARLARAPRAARVPCDDRGRGVWRERRARRGTLTPGRRTKSIRRAKGASPAMPPARACTKATKRSKLRSLTIRGGCLGAWGAAFIARGARRGRRPRDVSRRRRLRAEGATSVASLLSRGSTRRCRPLGQPHWRRRRTRFQGWSK